jgi:hypothetical protein
MRSRRRSLLVAGAALAILVAGLGPARVAQGAEDSNPPEAECNPDGRLFCIDVTTFSGITASDSNRADGDRFTWVEWQVRNEGGSTLTHVTVTVTLTDFCGLVECGQQTSAFVMPDSSRACSLGGSILTCRYKNLSGGGNTGDPTRIYLKTADRPATRSVIEVTGTVKERRNDANQCAATTAQGNDPNCDTFTTSVTSSYEPVQNAAFTFALPGSSFHLATNDELSSYDFTSGSQTIFRADFQTLFPPACGSTPSPTCFQRILEVIALDAPEDGYNDGPIVFYARLTKLPPGVTVNNVVGIHTYDDGHVRVIGDVSGERSKKGCTTEFSSQIPIPSICAVKVNAMTKSGSAGAIDVWLWDSENGRVGYG